LAALSVGLLVNTMLVIGSIAFMSYVAQVLIAYMAGRWILQRVQPAWAERPVVPLVAGLILYIILRAIPVLGTLVGWLVVLLALGALWEWGRAAFRRIRPTPAPIVGLQPARRRRCIRSKATHVSAGCCTTTRSSAAHRAGAALVIPPLRCHRQRCNAPLAGAISVNPSRSGRASPSRSASSRTRPSGARNRRYAPGSV
jgi:hypothetical protein